MYQKDLVLAGLTSCCLVSLIALGRLFAVAAHLSRAGGLRRVFREPFSFGKYAYADVSSPGPGNGDGRDGQYVSRILPQAMLFHILVFLCLALEIPVYAYHYGTDVEGGSDGLGRPLYTLHLLSYLLLFSAFCIIVTLWSNVAVFEPNVWTALVNRAMLVLCLCYVLVTGLAVGVCMGVGGTTEDINFFSSFAFFVFCAYSIGALLMLGVCFLVLGCILQRRICTVLLTGSCSPRLTARVVRLNVVMLACFVCFTLRAFMVATLVQVESEGDVNAQPSSGWEKWQQEMQLEWAPHVIPCVAMLYLMRKAGEPEGNHQDWGDGNMGESKETFEGGNEAEELAQFRLSQGTHGRHHNYGMQGTGGNDVGNERVHLGVL
ncbi:unnamed protein product [Choristocarpus tenellus]